MKGPLLTLGALAGGWAAWEAAGWLAPLLTPGGAELVLRGGIAIALLGPFGRLLDHIAARGGQDEHG